jgi:hypothetical protein
MSMSMTDGIGFWMLTVTGYVITLGHMVVARLQESLDLFECDKEWQVLFILNLKPRFGRMPGLKFEIWKWKPYLQAYSPDIDVHTL